MNLNSLEDLYTHLLKDLYSAEKQLVEALPKIAKAAQAAELRQAFEDHLRQTEGHVERIESLFEAMEGSPGGTRCVGMEGLVEEGSELLKEDAPADVLDAGLIAAAQKVEHYEIASYGTARTWARQLGRDEAADILQQTLDEESMANELLTQIAESHVNIQAEEGTSD
jgi:ferritin-like metal-binding protein YciE